MAVKTNQNGLLSEINVTPFVDVMLVLLIIFMVTAPMMTQGLEVDLPQTKTVEALPTDADHMVLSIAPDGSLFLDEYPVAMEDLQAQTERNVVAANKQLFLKADKTVPYGVVVQVMGEVKAAGVDRLGVVAERDTTAPEPEKTEPEKPGEVRQ